MIEFYGEGNITLLHDQPFMATVLGGFVWVRVPD